MIAGRVAAERPEHLRKLVLYAPILSGLGVQTQKEAFSHNTWESAAEDFQRNPDGTFNDDLTDPILIDMFCSGCWLYDQDQSPNGGRRDACVPTSVQLIDLTKISAPTLIIYGDKDPYLDLDLVEASLSSLPEGSAIEKITGGSHVVYIEKPFYHDFQNRLLKYLNGGA